MSATTEIRMRGLVKEYPGGVRALDGLDLTVRDGEYLCLLGPTGAGKTTVLRALCGLVEPDGGTVEFDGKDVTEVPISMRKATMLSQRYALFPNMDVYDNVMFAPHLLKWGAEDVKRLATSLIDLVHMSKKVDSMPCELSGGQQQRTALARAMASDSDILLLDEPLRALDARLRIELRKELKSMVKDMGLTSIHVTHDQDEAMEVADRIAIIRGGKVIQVGTPKDVFQNPATPFVANFLGRSNTFEGTFVEGGEDHSVVELESGYRVRARPADLNPGDPAVVAVKIGATVPTRISGKEDVQDRKMPPGEMPDGYFRGQVQRTLFEGSTITIEVYVGGLGTVSARRSSRRYEDYSPGTEVAVTWQPRQASVFPMPEGGLEEELRLE